MVYQVLQGHLETWLAGCRKTDEEGFPVAGYIGQDCHKYLECGILAHGCVRARCAGCGYDFLIAYSCKGRGICPSCNTRRMVETAAHLVDQVFPQVPVRQWVLSFPKRLRYFLVCDTDLLNRVLRILCGSHNTLIYDADAIYDLMYVNDRLVLGLKGTLSEVELLTIRARLQGGALSGSVSQLDIA